MIRSTLGTLALVALAAACSDSAAPAGSGTGPTPADTSTPTPSGTSTTPPGGSTDAGPPSGDASTNADAAVGKGAAPSILPVTYARPDVGAPLTASELSDATDKVIALLRDTRYFDVVDERLHGWPETGPGVPAGSFWYGQWWSGVTVTKSGGQVTYRHSADGADNNGLRTAPLLEGACYAHVLWGAPLTARLVRRIARGFSADALAMKRSAGDTAKTMLARAHYGANVTSTEGGRTIAIDTSLDRPGQDGTSEYVHIPTNPTFGDIWIKNNRSKDDMGHVVRSIVQSQACKARLDASGQADLAQTMSLFQSWSAAVDADGFGIATLDKNAQVTMLPVTETLAHYTLAGNVECPGALAIRLLGSGAAGGLDCGNGISALELLGGSAVKGSAKQILRTHHEAAVNVAFLKGQSAAGLALLQGLASRVESDVPLASGASPSVNPNDIAALLIHAANAGVPLTSAEIRWLHARIALAHTGYRAPAMAAQYKVFDPATPDGTYAFEPGADGLSFQDIGALLGVCAAQYRNTAARPVLDCAKLATAF